ncbi:uncharacterized protein LOC128557089 [Mercenaria mercenaria]|uniref:uncharacterized protein LOC128557089 n=1 Tax=Mercenaria mercenaria TaxID=6596 RepID=UPI00234E8F06|nr:uncharacterized protein LOC128557089 [Mercenaria mercenaria]
MSKKQKNKSIKGLDPTQRIGGQLKQNKTVKASGEMEAVRVTRSSPMSASNTPSSLYEFIGESPLGDSNKNSGKKQSQSKADGKVTKKKVEKAKTVKIKPASEDKNKKKAGNTKTSVAPSKTSVTKCTPKGRVSKAVIPLENIHDENETKKGNKRLRALKPIPPPNLDDISPIACERKSTPSRKRASDSKKGINETAKNRKLRSSKGGEIQLTASVSYMESEEGNSADDSAIFVSPRQTMPRFNAAKTSTPANVSAKSKKMPVKNMSRLASKDTSTPNESKPKRGFTGIKGNISKLSPVQRLDTPTSDYGSMEVIQTPSPTPPVKASRKKRGNSPAFTLEDEDSGENFNLNKSVDRSYKKSKRKYETGRFSTSKLDEWADKVNSELEDIENFELSVEG